jgi:hypothetical protein
MYAEEYLADDANDYFDVSDVSIEESSSIDTEIREHRKLKEVYKRLNKDYYSYKKRFFDGDGYKTEKVELYSSPLLNNSFIRNAVTGIKMEHKVGSKYDDLYFRVIDVCPGTHTPLNDLSRKLYYNNPEQCERHLQITIPNEIKEKWAEKNLIARSKYCRV